MKEQLEHNSKKSIMEVKDEDLLTNDGLETNLDNNFHKHSHLGSMSYRD